MEKRKNINTYYDWLDFWEATYKKPTVSTSTYKTLKYIIKMVKLRSADCKLEELNEFYFQIILNEFGNSGYSKATINKISFMFKQSCRVALRNGLIKQNYAEYTEVPQAPTKAISALTVDEQRLLESYCNTIPDGKLFLFLLQTGLRREEMVNLKWRDYNRVDNEIKITKSKTKAGIRTVPLTRLAKNILESFTFTSVHRPIFLTSAKNPISATTMKKLYLKVRQATGLYDFTNHVCRHTFATRLIEKGASPKSVSTLLGHEKVDYALNIYTQIDKKHLIKEIHLLEV